VSRLVRKQVYLKKDQDCLIKDLAAKRKVTEAEIIREALDEYLADRVSLPPGNPLSEIVGLGASGSRDGSVEHDRDIYDHE